MGRTRPADAELAAIPEAVQQVIVDMAEEYEMRVTTVAATATIVALLHERGLIEYREP